MKKNSQAEASFKVRNLQWEYYADEEFIMIDFQMNVNLLMMMCTSEFILKSKKNLSTDSINRAYFPEMNFKHIIYVCISKINS